MAIHPKLAAFGYGFLQDAANLLTVMEQEGITLVQLKESVKASAKNSVLLNPPKHMRRGFMKRTTKAQREAMKEQRGLMKQPCKSCDEKRRGKR